MRLVIACVGAGVVSLTAVSALAHPDGCPKDGEPAPAVVGHVIHQAQERESLNEFDARMWASVQAESKRRRAEAAAQTTALASPPLSARNELNLGDSVLEVPNLETFLALATQSNVPGATGVQEAKFLITDLGSTSPQRPETTYFINTNNYQYHFNFYAEALGRADVNSPFDLRRFNAQTYWNPNRRNIAGTIDYRENFVDPSAPEAEKGLFTVGVWAGDRPTIDHIEKVYDEAVAKMPFAAGKIRFHLQGSQVELYENNREEFARRGIRVITNDEIYANVDYQAMNPGLGKGRLRYIDNESQPQPDRRDIVVYPGSPPNELPTVRGVATGDPQGPLGHVQIKAEDDGFPNAYVKDVRTHPQFREPLDAVGRGEIVYVSYNVAPEGVTVERISAEEAARFLEDIRPQQPQIPYADLSVTTIRPIMPAGLVPGMDALATADGTAYGSKAANVSELVNLFDETPDLPDMWPDAAAERRPVGFGVPFSFYDEFMKARRNPDGSLLRDPATGEPVPSTDPRGVSLYELAGRLQTDPPTSEEIAALGLGEDDVFDNTPALRERRLDAFRTLIVGTKENDREDGLELPPAIRDQLDYWHHLVQPRQYRRVDPGDPDSDVVEVPVLEREIVQKLRIRSSTSFEDQDGEDLYGFTGAGLFDSETHKPSEGHIQNTVRAIWASNWGYRAFEERTFWKVPHDRTYVGLAVHPNFPDEDELANGVAITKNKFNPDWPGSLITVQTRDISVTNPPPGAIPDVVLVARIGENNQAVPDYIRSSNQVEPGTHVLNERQLSQLYRATEVIRAHYLPKYGDPNDPEYARDFAMDIEFKFVREQGNPDGRLVVKQARVYAH